ncbi:unnamed protein product [Choristocarpus tenellus]
MWQAMLSSLSILLIMWGLPAAAFVGPSTYAGRGLVDRGDRSLGAQSKRFSNGGRTLGSQERRASRRSIGEKILKAGLDFLPLRPDDVGDWMETAIQFQGLSARNHLQSGFIGGTVGVIGTLMAIQVKVSEVKELTECPYCRSSGQLPCGTCFGAGSVRVAQQAGPNTAPDLVSVTCPECNGKTYITCINCKGDGRAVPNFLNKKVSRDPESEIEDVGYG